MKSKGSSSGFTLIELVLVMAIMGLLVSISVPRMDLVLVKAHQAATKSNLGSVRSALSIYYTDTEGHWPLSSAADGDGDLSLSQVLIPTYTNTILPPLTFDRLGSFNSLPENFDDVVREKMSASPPMDTQIHQTIPSTVGDIDNMRNPFGYDNRRGGVFIANDNYDMVGNLIFSW